MAKINGRADVEIRIYRNRGGGGYVIFGRFEEVTSMVRVYSSAQLDEQGLWLMLETLKGEMEGWLF